MPSRNTSWRGFYSPPRHPEERSDEGSESAARHIFESSADLDEVLAELLGRRDLDEALERLPRGLPVPHLARDAADVVQRVVLLGIHLEGRLPGLDRLLRIAQAHPRHSERVP